jgi:hypothetical protein
METEMGSVENTIAEAFAWLESFHIISELEQGNVRMLIEEIMPEGVNFIGSLAGVGKTWVALSMAGALSTGKPFLGEFKVPEAIPVLYLVPEMGSRAFRKRCERMGVPDNSMFMCRTLNDGLMRLMDERLRAAVNEIKPVIFLDSMIRFQTGEESSSSANAIGLASAIFELLRLGAPAVQCLHHSPKFAGKKDSSMTLENVLRGTGDIGAMCDAVWGLEPQRRRKGVRWDTAFAEESKELTRLTMKCVKPRDFEPAEEFVIQGRPSIDEHGDFEIISQDGGNELPPKDRQQRLDIMLRMIQQDPRVSANKISKATRWNSENLKKYAAEAGYRHSEEGWVAAPPPQTLGLSSFAVERGS